MVHEIELSRARVTYEHSRMPLYWDVLMLMPSFMDSRSDILSTMQSCKTMHRGGVQALLQRPVKLGVGSDDHESRFESFYMFMTNDETGDRFCALRHLLVYASGKIRGRTSRMLIEIFQKAAHHLESLDLPNCEALLTADEDISVAISALRNLKTLKTSEVSERSLSMLQLLRSSPVHVDLSANSNVREPISLLSKFQHTVQELRLSGIEMPSNPVQFPHMRALQISDTHSYPLALLVYLFPNLGRLTVSSASFPAPLLEEDFVAIRVANQNGQRDISWAGLDCLSGDSSDLFMLAVKCPVRVLEVHNLGSGELWMLAGIIKESRPAVLRLGVDCRRFYYIASFGSLLRDAPSRLTITFNLDGTEMDVSSLMTQLIIALTGRAITHLAILFSWHGPGYGGPNSKEKLEVYEDNAIATSPQEQPDSIGDYLDQMDGSVLGQRVGSAMPSLQYFSLHTGRAPSKKAVWAISQHDGKAFAKYLDGYPATKLLDEF